MPRVIEGPPTRLLARAIICLHSSRAASCSKLRWLLPRVSENVNLKTFGFSIMFSASTTVGLAQESCCARMKVIELTGADAGRVALIEMSSFANPVAKRRPRLIL